MTINPDFISPLDIGIFKYDTDSFERCYSEAFKELGIDVGKRGVAECRAEGMATKRILSFSTILKNAVSLRRCAKGKRLLILFDASRSDLILTSALKKMGGCDVAVWYWNTLRPGDTIPDSLHLGSNLHCFTFDSSDADRFDMECLNQFYPFEQDLDENNRVGESHSAFFVGVDKGRWKALITLSGFLADEGFASDFHVVTDDAGKMRSRPEWVMGDFMPYDEVLRKVCECEIVVDLAKPGQSGMTVRCLEALQYGKKIVTNNPMLADPAVWNPSNVFLVNDGRFSEEAFRSFLVRPYDSSKDEELKRRYSMRGWLERIAIDTLGVKGIAWE